MNDKNQMCFVVWSDEIEGRLDPFYYKPEFLDLQNKLSKLNCKKIKDISLDLKNGSTPSGGVFEKSGIPYFRSQDFNLFDFKVNQFITKEFHEKLNRSAIRPGDVLLAVVGATLGVVGYVPENIKEGNINQNIVRIRVKDKSVNSKYLAIILASDIGQKLILRNATITTQSYLNNYQLGNIKIPLPPLSIQNQIVEIMESAYKQKKEKEAEAERLLNSIDDYVLDELGIKMPEIKDKMCFVVSSDEVEKNRIDAYYYQPKFRELENVIENGKFKTVKLKDLLEKSYTENSKPKIGDKYILAINSKEGKIAEIGIFGQHLFKKGGGTKREIKSPSYKHFPESLLVSRINIQRGGCAIIDKEIGEIYSTNEFYSFKTSDNISIKFLHILVRSRIFLILINRDVSGQFGRFKEEQFLNLEIPLPPLPIQNKIAEEVKSRIETAKKLKEEARSIVERAKKEVEKILIGD